MKKTISLRITARARSRSGPPPSLCALASLLAGLLLLVGCSDTTSPERDEPAVAFTPVQDTVRADLGTTVVFAVDLENLPDAVTTFLRGETVVGTGTSHPYQAVAAGVDSLRVVVSGAGRTWTRAWTIVVADADRPPGVLNLGLAEGGDPSSVLVSWRKPLSDAWPLPIVRHYVAVTVGAPPTEAGWRDAVIDSVSQGTAALYQRLYDVHDSPLIVGDAEVYFGLRTRDEAGELSPVVSAGPFRVTRSWSIAGTVQDETGAPLAGVIIDYGCETCRSNTDVAGDFSLGPFREADRYVLRTLTLDENSTPDAVDAYYDFRTDTVGIATPMPLRIVLVGRRPLTAPCGDAFAAGGLLQLVAILTKTWSGGANEPPNARPNWQLKRWDAYPVPIWIEEAWTDVGGFDLKQVALQVVAEWNARMGREVLTPVDTPPAHGIELHFVPQFAYLGLAELVDPLGYTINEAVPNRILVRIRQEANTEVVASSVIRHELGHALGFGGHSPCPAHLMYANPAVTTPVTDDEFMAMRAVLGLPQHVPVDRYILP